MATDLFLSHDWGADPDNLNHVKVSKINVALKQLGYVNWFDNEKMAGNIQTKMADGIENTKCFIAFLTKRYHDKVVSGPKTDNCQLEFNYACQRVPLVGVVLDPTMKDTRQWKGIIGMNLAANLYVDMSGDIDDEAYLSQQIKCLENELAFLKIKPQIKNPVKGKETILVTQFMDQYPYLKSVCDIMDSDGKMFIKLGEWLIENEYMQENDLSFLHQYYNGGGNAAMSFLDTLATGDYYDLTVAQFSKVVVEKNRQDIVNEVLATIKNQNKLMKKLTLDQKEKLANELEKDVSGVATWKEFASHYGYTDADIQIFEGVRRRPGEYSPTNQLFRLIGRQRPNLPLGRIIEWAVSINEQKVKEILTKAQETIMKVGNKLGKEVGKTPKGAIQDTANTLQQVIVALPEMDINKSNPDCGKQDGGNSSVPNKEKQAEENESDEKDTPK